MLIRQETEDTAVYKHKIHNNFPLKERMGWNMIKRILTSLIGLLVFAAVIFSHHYVLYCAVTLVVMLMLHEMYGAMEIDKRLRVTGFFATLIMSIGFVLRIQIFAIFAAIMLFMLAMVILHGKLKASDVLSAAMITVFISVFMLQLIMIRKRCDQYTVLLPFICAWLTDTGAYFTGTFLGRHKLVPEISPKKTVEGAIGGVVLSTLGSIVYIIIMVKVMAGGMPATSAIVKFGIIGFVGSIISQIGDLIASCIKRDFGKKDYGSILPGHGGLLDRFDSVIFVIPFVYYAMMLIIR